MAATSTSATFDKKVVVITGASAGIGATLAQLLASHGTKVVLVARRKDALDAVAAKCQGNALVVVADVTDRAAVRRVVDIAVQQVRAAVISEEKKKWRFFVDQFLSHRHRHKQLGHIDVWINNAGQGISRLPSELTDEDIDNMMLLNVKSALYGMQEVLPHFRSRNQGHIINISSMLGRMPLATFRSAYCGAKHFLNALTFNMRTEVQQTHPGIQVSLVSPGVVSTDFGLNALHGGVDSRSLPNAQTPEEVAEVIEETIETREADVYTRVGSQAQVLAFYGKNGTDPQ
jgi:short-subunit dehydrogenase